MERHERGDVRVRGRAITRGGTLSSAFSFYWNIAREVVRVLEGNRMRLKEALMAQLENLRNQHTYSTHLFT